MSELLIQTKALCKIYRSNGSDVRALEGIDLEVVGCTTIFVVGESGVGKSTLLSILGLGEPATSGEYRVLGRSIREMRSAHRAQTRRKHFGVTTQEPQLISDLTTLENVLLRLLPDGMPSQVQRDQAMELLRELGLESKAHESAKSLSGGQMQRACLARALLGSPQILLLDEPTAHLDAASSRLCFSVLQSRIAGGASAIVSTHDLPAIELAREMNLPNIQVKTLRNGLLHDSF